MPRADAGAGKAAADENADGLPADRDGAAAGRPDARLIGLRLRQAREARGLSLREVARRISVSPGFISQVETGKANPSIGTLYSLVSELGLSLDEMMGDTVTAADMPPERPAPPAWPRVDSPLQRAAGRPTIRLSGVTWERLTAEDDPLVDFLYITYAPGSVSCPEDKLMRHGGREYGHVISGRMRIQIGFESYELGPGDSLHFDSTVPHRLANPYDEPCVTLWVVVGRRFYTDDAMPPADPESNHLPGLL
jgi:transcriptional regulator with XRE-family HTH domain